MDLSQYTDEELQAIAGDQGADLSSYSDEELAQIAGEEQPAMSGADRARAFVGGALDTATFGTSDEIAAALSAARQGFAPGSYDAALAQNRATQDQLKQSGYYTAGQFAGAIAPGVAAPKALKGALQYAAAKGLLPTVAASGGLGAVSGGLYGFGSGEGGARQRLEGVPSSAAWGGAGGVLGAGIAAGIGSLAQRAAKIFKKPSQSLPAASKAAQAGLPISGTSYAPDVKDLTKTGKATTLLKGAATQDVELMRAEELARQGVLGKDLEAAIRGADDAFKQSVKTTVQSLAGKNIQETSDDTFTKAIGLVKNRFDAQKKLQNKLMTARNDAIARTKVYADYTNETLGEALREIKNTPDFKVALMRDENLPIKKDIALLQKFINNKNVKDINMSYLSAWRSGLNTYQKGTQQQVLASRLSNVYDDWLDNHLKNAVKEGDEDLAQKIFSANSKYREFKTKYGTDLYSGQKNVIERIMREDDMTPRAMVNTVFGKSLDGKDYTEQYVKRMVETMPEGAQRQRVIDGFRAGLYQKAFEQAYDPVSDSLKFGKLKDNLIKMKSNPAFKKYLSAPEYEQMTDALIQDLAKYQRATGDKTIVNTSGTAPAFARMVEAIGGIPIVKSIPMVRGVTESIGEIVRKGAQATDRKMAEKSAAEFYKAISPIIDDNIKFNFRAQGAVSGSQAAASSNVERRKFMTDAQGNDYFFNEGQK